MQNLRHRVLKILVQPPRKSTKSLVFSNGHTQLIPPRSTAWRFFSACEGTPVSLESCSPREHFHPVLRVPAMEEPPMKRPRLLNPDFQENAAIQEDEGGRKETTFWDGGGKALQPRLSQQRRWEAIPGSKEKSCSFDFLVLSYNILSQQLLEDNLWLYQHCRRDVLSWAFRFPQLISEISRFNADIVCLQEVQYSHFYKQIKPALSEMGYKCRYKVRTGDKRDGCAICFKRSRFDLLSWKPVEYFHPGVAVLNRDNVGGIVMLRPLGIPEANQLVDLQFCVANTHLLYNPRRGDVKLAQLAVLLAEIDWTSRQENSQCPVLLCGDFNSVPGSPLYRFIRDGSLYYRQMPIWQVSGQEELHGVNWNVLEAPLWPKSVGISPCCRYLKRSPPRDKEQASEERETTKPTCDDDSSVHTSAAETKQDFNAQSTPLQRLAEVEGCSLQSREENFPNTIRHGMSFRSVYSHFIQAQGKAEATTCHSKTGVTVDYIFYSNPSGVSSPGKESTGVRLHLLERLALLSVADLWTENSLPNDVAPSDHLPLVAKFRLEW